MIKRRLASEDGVALALALAFVALFGLLIAAVLSFSETGFRAGRALRGQGEALAAADAAVDGAINRLRSDLDSGVEGDDFTCFEPPAINGVLATVRCEGQAGSGVAEEADDPTTPQHAILTLGTGADGETGISKSVSSTMNVTGSIFSNSTIDVSGTLAATDEVQALGDCTGNVTGSSVACANNGGGANAADGVDPDYAKETSTVPVSRSVPACGSGWLVSFQPGMYRDAAALTTLMNGGCSKVFHFEPGVYYFHFDVPSVSHTWTISDANATVIGGVPDGWSTGASSAPSLSVPGACDTDASGVQFIFGGDSRLRVTTGALELCPVTHDDAQQISLYGLKTGTVTATNATQTASAASSSAFSPANNGRVIDGSVATATIPSNTTVTASLTGFTGIPAGSVITSASLRVAHVESSTTDVNQLRAILNPASGSSVTFNIPRRTGSLGTDTINMLSNGLSAIADLSSYSVTYSARARNGATPTAQLDGIELVLTYEAPQWEAQSGCLVQTPYTGSGAPCPFVQTSGTNTKFVMHGTVYAPLSPVDASLPNTSGLHFARGVVARALRLAVPSSFSQAQAPFRIPSGSGSGPRADREVLLTAIIDGVDRVRARVVFEDDGGDTPGQTVRIETWSVVR